MGILLTFMGFCDPYVPGSIQPGLILSLFKLREFVFAVFLRVHSNPHIYLAFSRDLNVRKRLERRKLPAIMIAYTQLRQVETKKNLAKNMKQTENHIKTRGGITWQPAQ